MVSGAMGGILDGTEDCEDVEIDMNIMYHSMPQKQLLKLQIKC